MDPQSKIKTLADQAFHEAKEGNITYWTIKDDDPEAAYWKEVWLKGYRKGTEVIDKIVFSEDLSIFEKIQQIQQLLI